MGAGLQGLRLQQVPRPVPAAGEVLVRMCAASLNFRDIAILVHGRYPLPVKPDVVALADGAGDVVEVGAGVDRVQPGDRVIASVFPHWLDGPFRLEVAAQLGGSLDGMLAEFACLPQEALVRIPGTLDDVEAATLPCAALTAWHALTAEGALRPGETVLTLGSGAVSLFALQFAHALGAHVIVTTSDETTAGRLSELGAGAVVNYSSLPEWAPEVRRLTGGRGADRVVEVAGSSLPQSLRATRLGGSIALVGTRGGTAAVDVGELFAAGVTVRPIAIGSRRQLEAMVAAVDRHRVHPVVDKVFAFADAAAAFAHFLSGAAFGKVVIRFDA